MGMKQPKMRSERGVGALEVNDVSAFKDLPNIRDFMLCQAYPGTTVERVPGVMILTARAGVWVLTAKESSKCLLLKLQATALDELWLTLEEMLESEDAPWESDPYEMSKRKNSRRGGGR
jgi:hypothetical protein